MGRAGDIYIPGSCLPCARVRVRGGRGRGLAAGKRVGRVGGRAAELNDFQPGLNKRRI